MYLQRVPARDHGPSTDVRTLASLLCPKGSVCIDSSDLAVLIALAREHRVELEVYGKLVEAGVEIPAEIAGHCVKERLLRRARRAREERVLTAVKEALSMPFVVVKGPVIASRWYDDPIDRDYGDLDLLVRRRDFRAAVDALTAAGFESPLANWHGFARHGVAEIPLTRDDVNVDLHWDLVATASNRSALTFEIDEMLDRAIPVTIGNEVVSTLDDVDTILHLCVNAGLDGAHRLGQLLDIHRMVNAGLLIDDRFVVRARRSGAAALCAAVLQRCSSVFGTAVDQRHLRALEPWNGWLTINRLFDRSTRRLVASDSVASGIVLSSGRSSRRTTLAVVGDRTISSLRARVLGRRRTDAGGDLDWQRQPASGDVASARRSYLEWVDRGAEYRSVRCDDALALEAMLQAHEPRATPLVGAALSAGLRGRRGRAYVIERADGQPAAALVGYRWTVGGRTGYPLVLEEAAAVPVADLIERLGITDLGGFDQDLQPLRALLPRWRSATPCSAVALPPGFRWGAAPSTTRHATSSDVRAITDLMWNHSPQGFANPWLLRRRVRRAIDELVIVIDAGEPPRIVGVAARDSATTLFHCWAHIVLDPAFRKQRRSWDLVAAGAAAAHAEGAGVLGFVVASNPMPIPEDALLRDDWNYVELSAPNRCPGERLLRHVVGRLFEWGAATPWSQPEEYRAPGASDSLVTDRRTQEWWYRR